MKEMKKLVPRAARLLSAAAVLFTALAAHAQPAVDNYPSRPITMVVPASAGSGTDMLAREVSTRLGLALKQPIIVDNRAGASGIPGISAVVRAAHDGYTLLWTNASFAVMSPALMKNLPYDISRDLVPVTQTVVGGVILMVNKDFPPNNLQELVAYVKASPGKYTYGSWGVGSSGHLMMEWLKKQTGMQITHVPYRQVPQMLTELSTGVLPIAWADPSSPVPFLEAGRIKGIAVSGNQRSPRTASIPTMGEQGYRFDTVGWFGVFAPAGTPPVIVKRLTDEINKVLGSPEVVARMNSMNFAPPPMVSSEEFRRIVQGDLKTWKSIVSDAGITLDN